MRVLVCGAGGFVGAHVVASLRRAGHEPVTLATGPIDAAILLDPGQVRQSLDVAWRFGARRVVLLSSVGADPRSPRPQLASRGRAEDMVRASNIPWVVLRAEILWGPGDVFTNELAHLLTHLPFVPIAKRGPFLEPVYAGDAAAELVEMLTSTELVGAEWTLVGPEALSYGEVAMRVADALGLSRRRYVALPSWMVRAGAALEERLARRPRVTRKLLDRLVAHEHALARAPRRNAPRAALRPLVVEALREYLIRGRSPSDQLHGLLAT
jgi:NADH dehydrogenase